jgi:putative endonuclease
MRKEASIYIMTNKGRSTLYIGVTSDLIRRVVEHKLKVNSCFASKYNLDKLVYFEHGVNVLDAIKREKQLKNWHREWKENLISEFNSEWRDLSCEIGVTEEILKQVQDDEN